jgi:hypothetical protein
MIYYMEHGRRGVVPKTWTVHEILDENHVYRSLLIQQYLASLREYLSRMWSPA